MHGIWMLMTLATLCRWAVTAVTRRPSPGGHSFGHVHVYNDSDHVRAQLIMSHELQEAAPRPGAAWQVWSRAPGPGEAQKAVTWSCRVRV